MALCLEGQGVFFILSWCRNQRSFVQLAISFCVTRASRCRAPLKRLQLA